MIDLSTSYLGLKLKNPLIAAASPLTKKADTVRHLEEAGIGAVVLFSLFEEQIMHESRALDHYLTRHTESFAEALTYFPDLDHYNIGPDVYLETITRLKRLVEIPIIASLNGISSSGWIRYAKMAEEAGADAIELNLYYLPTEANLTSQELEQNYVDLITDINRQIKIPLSVKLSPFFTALPNMAHQMVKAGAKGLVLFNRFYQPDLDIETLDVIPTIQYSTSADLLLPLRWVAVLYGRIEADLALSSGVHSGSDAIKAIMAGASGVQMASELLANGVDRIGQILADMHTWMNAYEYDSIERMRGSMSHRAVAEPAAFERANYMKALTQFNPDEL